MINLGGRVSFINPSKYRVINNIERLNRQNGLTYKRYIERLGEEIG